MWRSVRDCGVCGGVDVGECEECGECGGGEGR